MSPYLAWPLQLWSAAVFLWVAYDLVMDARRIRVNRRRRSAS